MRVELSQVDDGGGWFVDCVSANNGVVIGRRRGGRTGCGRDKGVVLHADLFNLLEISVSIATSFVGAVVSATALLAVVGVFQRMCEGGVVEFLFGVELMELVGRIRVGAEEGSEEVERGIGRRRFGGAVLLDGSQVGRWGLLMRSRRPFILWRGLSL